jgi:Ala-tRNA(Pro) deacylase
MLIKKLKDFLDRAGVSYETVLHSIVYTSNELASATHTPRTEIAKTVIVLIDGVMAMVVLPARPLCAQFYYKCGRKTLRYP